MQQSVTYGTIASVSTTQHPLKGYTDKSCLIKQVEFGFECREFFTHIKDKETDMISWAVTFFVIALIAAVLGFTGIAGAAGNLAWICAVIGIVLALVFMVMGRRPPV